MRHIDISIRPDFESLRQDQVRLGGKEKSARSSARPHVSDQRKQTPKPAPQAQSPGWQIPSQAHVPGWQVLERVRLVRKNLPRPRHQRRCMRILIGRLRLRRIQLQDVTHQPPRIAPRRLRHKPRQRHAEIVGERDHLPLIHPAQLPQQRQPLRLQPQPVARLAQHLRQPHQFWLRQSIRRSLLVLPDCPLRSVVICGCL